MWFYGCFFVFSEFVGSKFEGNIGSEELVWLGLLGVDGNEAKSKLIERYVGWQRYLQ
jgi:hypothetical protein